MAAFKSIPKLTLGRLFVKAANALSTEKVEQFSKDFQSLRYPLGMYMRLDSTTFSNPL